jgi:DNA polymerase I
MEMEKIYSKYFLLSKKRYVGFIVDESGKVIKEDKKGVVTKRRDGCGYLRKMFNELMKMVMDKRSKGEVYRMLYNYIHKLTIGEVELDDLILVKGLKDNYKNLNLPHVRVGEKMKERGKYVTPGTRISYVFIETESTKDPQYVKAEDPEYVLASGLKIDYLYYIEKQLINPIDEVLEVKFQLKGVLKNMYSLMKKGEFNVKDYFIAKFKVL